MIETPGWKLKTKPEIKEIFDFAEAYKRFLDGAKTEREAAAFVVGRLSERGFSADGSLRCFGVNRAKELIAFVAGSAPFDEGLNIVAAHTDAPRLDLKQNPLYEDVDLALLRTHYYGGIKKYQWVSIPLAIHGVVVRADGSTVDISLGDGPDDPVFAIDDLLPHLSRSTQEQKKLSEAIEGEKLTLLFGSLPMAGVDKEPVKHAVLSILADRYGICEEDFISAELEVVPAFPARDVGLDRSMIGAYGQDDRASAFAMLEAIAGCEKPRRSCLAIFADKEEIGSEGNTALQSSFLTVFLYGVLKKIDPSLDYGRLKEILFRSRALSADVNAAVNPDYQEVHERQNASMLGRGICISKFTGHGGKGGASDANAEYVGEIRRLFNEHGILWHAAELGKVDQGGGGTVAKFLAQHGMDVLDCGPSLLTMHSPFEISSKLDIYETYRAFKAFFRS